MIWRKREKYKILNNQQELVRQQQFQELLFYLHLGKILCLLKHSGTSKETSMFSAALKELTSSKEQTLVSNITDCQFYLMIVLYLWVDSMYSYFFQKDSSFQKTFRT